MSAYKGPRRQLAARLPVDLADLVEKRAAAAGLPVSEFLTRQLAAALAESEHNQDATAA